ncbi:hypothetical protein BCR34DRAFT_80481 [Clohesyomyces aquaticus]|uniref:Uncharacterized protein n=1 Tax=Clohesyomyces aquaticus TaxID=1231657 RepID=A0A1Y1YWV2_9PLEO|nr:hypothetical protein BCR34DRAFT_80481 [Clohesyomyces aquaticus]
MSLGFLILLMIVLKHCPILSIESAKPDGHFWRFWWAPRELIEQRYRLLDLLYDNKVVSVEITTVNEDGDDGIADIERGKPKVHYP